MTSTKRWLDELPLGSRERELLLVGKAARPAQGAIDANWQALRAALGTTAAASGTFVSSAAVSSATASVTAANTGAPLAASKAASAGLLLIAAKSLTVGVAVGLAVMGAASVAEHMSRGPEHPAAVMKRVQAPTARQPAHPPPLPSAKQPDSSAVKPATAASNESSSLLRAREPAVANSPAPAQSAALAATASLPEDKTASLARQARELAELKRLIDSGAPHEAVRRLEQNFSEGTASVLSEERDALYVQALARAQRRDEARRFARQFLIRYPHSPYFEAMRQLLTAE